MKHREHHSAVCKSQLIRFVDFSLYWVLLVVAILANFVLSVTLVPFLMTMEGIALYSILFIIAVTFGFLFSQILHAIELLHPRQHLVLGILIPSIALINFAILTLLSNKLIIALQLNTAAHNPWVVGLVYVVGYGLPEALTHRKRKHQAF